VKRALNYDQYARLLHAAQAAERASRSRKATSARWCASRPVRPGAEGRGSRLRQHRPTTTTGAARARPRRCRTASSASACRRCSNCIPMSTPGVNRWPRAKLSDKGFEDEQQFDGIMAARRLRVRPRSRSARRTCSWRLGNQVVNRARALFHSRASTRSTRSTCRRPRPRERAPSSRKSCCRCGWRTRTGASRSAPSEAFYQFKWDNTSVDGCGTYWAQTFLDRFVEGRRVQFATAIGDRSTAPRWRDRPTIAARRWGSAAFPAGAGPVPAPGERQGASDSGASRRRVPLPPSMRSTPEIGIYGMKDLHSRLPIILLAIRYAAAGPHGDRAHRNSPRRA